MESARISMSLEDYNKEMAKANVNGCLTGQKNIIEVFQSFAQGKQDKIDLPSDMNAAVKKLAIEFIEQMNDHFGVGEAKADEKQPD